MMDSSFFNVAMRAVLQLGRKEQHHRQRAFQASPLTLLVILLEFNPFLLLFNVYTPASFQRLHVKQIKLLEFRMYLR